MKVVHPSVRVSTGKSLTFSSKAKIAGIAICVVLALTATTAFSLGVSAETFKNLLFGSAGSAMAPVTSVEQTTAPVSFESAEPHFSAPVVADGALENARSGHTATLLANGQVLIAGGSGGTSAEIYDPATGISASANAMNAARSGHTATLLGDGRVIITGGSDGGASVASTEIYDPSNGTFSSGPAMASARSGHTATALSNGSILFTGGGSDSAEIFDGTAFIAVSGAMTASRTDASAISMNDGRVFIAGGDGSNTAEIFNPADSTFTAVGNQMTLARSRAICAFCRTARSRSSAATATARWKFTIPQSTLSAPMLISCPKRICAPT